MLRTNRVDKPGGGGAYGHGSDDEFFSLCQLRFVQDDKMFLSQRNICIYSGPCRDAPKRITSARSGRGASVSRYSYNL